MIRQRNAVIICHLRISFVMDSPIISWLDEEFQRDNDCPLPPSLDDSTDVSGLDMDMVSPRTSRDTSEKHVPVIRLEEDAELRVWRASSPDSTTLLSCAVRPTLIEGTHSHW